MRGHAGNVGYPKNNNPSRRRPSIWIFFVEEDTVIASSFPRCKFKSYVFKICCTWICWSPREYPPALGAAIAELVCSYPNQDPPPIRSLRPIDEFDAAHGFHGLFFHFCRQTILMLTVVLAGNVACYNDQSGMNISMMSVDGWTSGTTGQMLSSRKWFVYCCRLFVLIISSI